MFRVSTALNTTLLIRCTVTGKYLVNFDIKITEAIQEASSLVKMGLDVPKQALHFLKVEGQLKTYHHRLHVSLFSIICRPRCTLEITLTVSLVFPPVDHFDGLQAHV